MILEQVIFQTTIGSSEKDVYVYTVIEGYMLIPDHMAFGSGSACCLAFYVYVRRSLCVQIQHKYCCAF